ncbi:voltage-gated chloride channel TMC4 isoform X2 [Microcaecilia unicolor]|uniref:Transmembrane channel-like protein n=1 Tax=Microcaecilia unicolor TaxID=1415580 RepID=A0A6P7XDY1_9AMPH|nr:transmembrane channel-like protein 4 isoform X2 [Microcaecilia unicolor]
MRIILLSQASISQEHPQHNHHSEAGSPSSEVQQQEWIAERLEGDSRSVKELPLNLSEKRRIRERQELRMRKMSGWNSWMDRQHRAVQRLWEQTTEAFQYTEMWRGSLHRIEGHFGSGVQSYFSFLRFLVLMNFVTFLLVGGFIVIPNMVFEELQLKINTTSPVTTGNQTCFDYNPKRQGLVQFYEYVMDLLSGTGYMELTYLFYGFYENTAVDLKTFSYNIPLAYLITILFYFLLSLVWTVIRSVNRFKQSLVNEDSSLNNYSNKVFVGWDFCISEEQSVRLKQNSLRYELKMDLEEEALKKRQAAQTKLQCTRVYTLRTIVHLLVLALLGAAFYTIYVATGYSQQLISQDSVVSSNFFLGLLVQYLPSIVITAAITILPIFFNIFSRLEKYSLTWEIKLTLIRCVFLRFASLVILLYSLWTQITCNGQKDESHCKTCGYNNIYPCWETRLGQEMYKLAIFDFLTVLVMILLVDFPRRMIVQHCSCKLIQLWGQQEFQVPSNVLDLIYGQTVCWIGTFFCPLLPLLNTIKYFIIFYLKKMTLLKNCCPAKRTFRASSSNFFFLLVLLFGLALSWVPILYSIFVITPSKACGPFQGQFFIWDTIPNAVEPLPQVTKEFLYFISSQAFLVPIFLLLCILISYLVALANSYGQLVKELKVYMQLEGRDKHFLVKQINRTE